MRQFDETAEVSRKKVKMWNMWNVNVNMWNLNTENFIFCVTRYIYCVSQKSILAEAEGKTK